MYKVSKKPWYVLIFLVWGLLVGFLFWLTRDEPLSKEAELLLANVQLYDASITEHPYFDVLGFDARSDLDSQVLGRLIYRQGWSEYYNTSDVKIDYERNRQKLSRLKFEYLTNDEKNLLKEILNQNDEHLFYRNLLNNKLQLQRLYLRQSVLNKKFQDFVKQHNSTKPLLLSVNTDYPNYSLIRMAHLIYLSDLFFKNDKTEIAIYIEQLIYKSTKAENLVEKMVIISMLSQSVVVLNHLNHGEISSNIRIPTLTKGQMSLRSSLSVEFASLSVYWDQINSKSEGMGLFDHIDEHGNVVDVKPLKKYFLKALSPFLFLKNMTKNEEARYYQSIIEITELNNPKFKSTLIDKTFEKELKLKSIRNVFGQKLAHISSPSWLKYSMRLRLLNQKIQVFNVLANNRQFDLKQLNLNTDGYEYYRTETELCIKSPDPNQDEEEWKKYKSCLRI